VSVRKAVVASGFSQTLQVGATALPRVGLSSPAAGPCEGTYAGRCDGSDAGRCETVGQEHTVECAVPHSHSDTRRSRLRNALAVIEDGDGTHGLGSPIFERVELAPMACAVAGFRCLGAWTRLHPGDRIAAKRNR